MSLDLVEKVAANSREDDLMPNPEKSLGGIVMRFLRLRIKYLIRLKST